jgi:hypothetical protein
MTDLSQPATAAEFVAAGASAADAAILAEQHNAMAGHRGADARAALSVAARDVPPPAARPPAASPVTQAQAVNALEAHEAAQLNAEMGKMFAPPAAPSDYRFPPSPRDPTDAEFAQDGAIKAAFYSEGMPRWLGEGIVKSLVEGEHALSRMTPEQASTRVASTVASLQRIWGREYDSNLAIVDNLLEQMSRRNPGLGIDGTVRLDNGHDVPLLSLLDPLTVNSLLEFAKHRAGRR